MVTIEEATSRIDFLLATENRNIVITDPSFDASGAFQDAIRESLISLHASSDLAAQTIEQSAMVPFGV